MPTPAQIYKIKRDRIKQNQRPLSPTIGSTNVKYPRPTLDIDDPIGVRTSKAVEDKWVRPAKADTSLQRLVPTHPDPPKPIHEHDPGPRDPVSRQQRVAAHAAHHIINNKGFRVDDHEHAPSNPLETVPTWRMRRKAAKTTKKAVDANNIEARYTFLVDDPKNPGQKKKVFSFTHGWDNLTFTQKGRRKKDRRKWNRLQKQRRRMTEGRRLPLTETHVMGFKQIANPKSDYAPDDVTMKEVHIAPSYEGGFPELQQQQTDLYAKIIEGRDSMKPGIDSVLSSQYQTEVNEFKAQHGRDPYPIEAARLRLQATDKVYRFVMHRR